MAKTAKMDKMKKLDKMDKTLKIVENSIKLIFPIQLFLDEIRNLGSQIKPSVRSNENILNSNPIVPIDYF